MIVFKKNQKSLHRRGFAIIMVVVIALMLASFSAVLWHSNRDFEPLKEFVIEKKQSEYLAKGAQQHFLLKFRYLPTELYDAVAYSTGKNPYYDFGRPHTGAGALAAIAADDAVVNPGPMFYFGSTSVTIDGGIPKVDRSGVDLENPGIGGATGDQIRALLKMYILDVGTMYPTNDNSGIIVISSDAHADKAFGDGWRDPFTGNYAVQNATILGLSGGKRYDKDSLLVTTVGSVKRAGQISVVTQGNIDGARNLQTGKKRISDLSFGVNEFPEAKNYLEDVTEYNARVAEDTGGVTNQDITGLTADAVLSSGRRTEIATGIYRISRQN